MKTQYLSYVLALAGVASTSMLAAAGTKTLPFYDFKDQAREFKADEDHCPPGTAWDPHEKCCSKRPGGGVGGCIG